MDSRIWDLIGILFLLVAGYFVVTRTLLPQFAFPWFGRRRRRRAIEQVNALLADPELDHEQRFHLERCKNTLIAYDSGHREVWSGSPPVADIVKEINEMWEARAPASRT